MEGKDYGQEAAQDAQQEGRPQEPDAQSVVADADASAYEAQIAERDGRIAELEAQVAEAAKTAEAIEALKSQIEELKKQGESDRLDFELRLADVRNVRAARDPGRARRGRLGAQGGGALALLRRAEAAVGKDRAFECRSGDGRRQGREALARARRARRGIGGLTHGEQHRIC